MPLPLRASEGALTLPSRSRRLTSATAVSSGLVSFFVSLAAASSVAHAASGSHGHGHSHRDKGESAAPTRHHKALIKVSTAKLRSAPGTKSKATALLDAGRGAKVIGRRSGWVQLRLDSGKEGWVRKDLVEVAKSASHDEDAPSRHSAHKKHEDDPSESRHSRHVAAASGHHREERVVIAKKTHESHKSAPVHKTVIAIAAKPPKEKSHDRSEPSIVSTQHKVVVQAIADARHAVRHVEHTTLSLPDAEFAAAATPHAERLVGRALSYRGTPYRMGATGNGAFDCSGFTQYLFNSEGHSIPRTAEEQYNHGHAVPKDELQAGDLVFFQNTYKHGVSHVGLYIGNGAFVHASSGQGHCVKVSRLDEAYYINHWAGARRPR